MPALTEIFGDDSVLQFGGGTLGHPWGNAPGAVANRVALEACVQARNEGRDLAAEGNTIIREACKWSPELAAACEVWKEIKFEFKPVDTLDKYMNNDSTSEDSLYNRSIERNDNYISRCVFDSDNRRTISESGRSSIPTRATSSELTLSDLTLREKI
ncbi:hypothetical protein ACJIZ3_000265 [Penstemon smallii]|uniref:Ribulose bisphosphate carboxylase large subunit C-terminal domain-containing protein n=1 Tax=Penstemon smallii TaxID=265156 RepID=A0ABD3RDQ4_9LAMI